MCQAPQDIVVSLKCRDIVGRDIEIDEYRLADKASWMEEYTFRFSTEVVIGFILQFIGERDQLNKKRKN